MRLKRFVTATPFCKVCHRRIERNSLYSLVFAEKTICLRCFHSLEPKIIRSRKASLRITSLYPYHQTFQSLLYLYKGCGDIELSTVFLERFKPLLKLRYRRHVLVPAPSSERRITERGFDHVPLIFQGIGKRVQNALIKTSDVKQSDLSKNERRKIGKHLALLPKTHLEGERILFVDDVMTTGSTAKACVALLKKLNPKSIEVMVLARVSMKEKTPMRT